MFCVRCGREATVDNFCNNCFLERNELFKIKDFDMSFCGGCKNFFDAGNKTTIQDAVEKRIKTYNKIKDLKIVTKEVGNKIFVIVACSGLIIPCKKVKNEEKNILIKVRKMMCENCKRISGNYYEAVIQIRGDCEKIMKKISRVARKSLIVGMNNVDNGYDIRFVNKKEAAHIARILRDKYNVKETFKLVGEKKGKKLYRNFYAIR